MRVEARHVVISGSVQGVAFRWSTREEAVARGVAGWVRNLPDGRVEARIEGDPQAVEDLLGWLEEGPPSARVTGLDVRVASPEGSVGFDIVR